MWKSIQGLRGTAALMVIAYHVLGAYGLLVEHDAHANAWQAGVDVFFVISGFVMVAATYGRDVTHAAFLRARLQRIVPFYWLALVAELLLLSLAPHGLPPLNEIVKAFLFIPYYNEHAQALVPFLVQGWTLSYELYFYILFAVTLGFRPLKQITVLAGFFVLFLCLRKVIGDADPIAFRLTSPIPFEFLAGVALGHFFRGRQLPEVLGIGLIVLALALWISPFHLQARTIGFGIPAACLVAGTVILERWFRMPWAKPAQAIGDASYSLYLTHNFVVTGVHRLLPHAPLALGAVIMVSGAVVLALLIHRFVERPLLAFFRSLAWPGRVATVNPS